MIEHQPEIPKILLKMKNSHVVGHIIQVFRLCVIPFTYFDAGHMEGVFGCYTPVCTLGAANTQSALVQGPRTSPVL